MTSRALLRRINTLTLSAALLGGSLAAVTGTSEAGASPSVSLGTHTVSYSITCSVGIFGSQTLSGSIKLTTPNTVAPGAKFKATGVRATIVIPKSLVNAAFAVGIRTFKGRLNKYTVTSSDAKPSPLNGAGATGKPIPKTKLVQNSSVTLSIPSKTTSFSMGPWTAGTKGTDTGKAGATTATVHAYNSSGALITTINASCKAPVPSKIFAVTVS